MNSEIITYFCSILICDNVHHKFEFASKLGSVSVTFWKKEFKLENSHYK